MGAGGGEREREKRASGAGKRRHPTHLELVGGDVEGAAEAPEFVKHERRGALRHVGEIPQVGVQAAAEAADDECHVRPLEEEVKVCRVGRARYPRLLRALAPHHVVGGVDGVLVQAVRVIRARRGRDGLRRRQRAVRARQQPSDGVVVQLGKACGVVEGHLLGLGPPHDHAVPGGRVVAQLF